MDGYARKFTGLKGGNCFVGFFKDIGQSGGDGTCPLMQACFGADAHSGDLFTPTTTKWYMPFYLTGLPQKVIVCNRARPGGTHFSEANTLSKDNQDAAWSATQAAIRMA